MAIKADLQKSHLLATAVILYHLSEAGPHIFISLEQASELVQDISFNQRFHESFGQYNVLYASVQAYILKIEAYIADLVKSKVEIISQIVQEFQAKLDLMSEYKRKAVTQLEIIKNMIKSHISTRDEVLTVYEEKGLK